MGTAPKGLKGAFFEDKLLINFAISRHFRSILVMSGRREGNKGCVHLIPVYGGKEFCFLRISKPGSQDQHASA